MPFWKKIYVCNSYKTLYYTDVMWNALHFIILMHVALVDWWLLIVLNTNNDQWVIFFTNTFIATSFFDELCRQIQPTWSGFIEASPWFIYLYHQYSLKYSRKRLSGKEIVTLINIVLFHFIYFIFFTGRWLPLFKI